jgi:putative ubiquitin-RnfH superfamily antitoxin RatB of RatAB toxin-antitoxin module
MPENKQNLQCELVYVPQAGTPVVFVTQWVEGLTVAAILEASGFLQHYPEIQTLAVGIFARQVTPDSLIKPGDRVEVYRPLLLDPKEKRRKKAKIKT